MTRVGLLGRPEHLESLTRWDAIDVRWGVDSSDDAVSGASREPVDVLVVEGRMEYLVESVLALVPDHLARVIAVAETADQSAWLAAFDGVEVAVGLARVRELLSSTSDLGDTDSGSPAAPAGRVIAVWGTVGAPGVSTTAIALASVCARSGQSVLLCDADTRGASIAIGLGLVDEAPGFAAACRLAGRGELTAVELNRLATPFARREVKFSVLTGLPRASRWAALDPARVREVLTFARHEYDAVIVDVGFGIEENDWVDEAPQRDGAAREILRLSDAVIAVGRADAVGLARLIRGLDDLRDLRRDPIIVLNAVPPHTGREAIDAVHRFTDHRVSVTIPRDSRSGLEDAVARSKPNTAPWARLGVLAGVGSTQRKAGFRWRR